MGDDVAADEWVVLSEQAPPKFLFDGASLNLLYLEQELVQQGIETAFDPFRPGEEPSPSYRGREPIRLMVKVQDLERARQVASDLLSPQGMAPEPDAPLDDNAGWQNDLEPSDVGSFALGAGSLRPTSGPPRMPPATRPTAGCLGGVLLLMVALTVLITRA